MSSSVAVKSITENRLSIKAVAEHLFAFFQDLKNTGGLSGPGADNPELFANLMLAYRHLEDASMRLGKAIQAADGGDSASPSAVGAPKNLEEMNVMQKEGLAGASEPNEKIRKPYNDN